MHPPAFACSLQLCVVLNNVELVRRASGQALRGLAWPEGIGGVETTLPRALLSCTQALEEDLEHEAHTVTAHLTSKVGSGPGPGVGVVPGIPYLMLSITPADGG